MLTGVLMPGSFVCATSFLEESICSRIMVKLGNFGDRFRNGDERVPRQHFWRYTVAIDTKRQ